MCFCQPSRRRSYPGRRSSALWPRPCLYLPFLALCLLVVCTAPAAAAVFDLTIADVTTRAFSVVWVSDEPVTDATVRVFRDAGGMTNITSALAVTLVSAAFSPALAQGIVKVGVTGLTAGTSVFVQTQTTGTSGTVLFPAVPPFLEVHTATKTTKANALGQPIVNDLILTSGSWPNLGHQLKPLHTRPGCACDDCLDSARHRPCAG